MARTSEFDIPGTAQPMRPPRRSSLHRGLLSDTGYPPRARGAGCRALRSTEPPGWRSSMRPLAVDLLQRRGPDWQAPQLSDRRRRGWIVRNRRCRGGREEPRILTCAGPARVSRRSDAPAAQSPILFVRTLGGSAPSPERRARRNRHVDRHVALGNQETSGHCCGAGSTRNPASAWSCSASLPGPVRCWSPSASSASWHIRCQGKRKRSRSGWRSAPAGGRCGRGAAPRRPAARGWRRAGLLASFAANRLHRKPIVEHVPARSADACRGDDR